MPETLELRRVTRDDWRALKNLRLAALLDEPTAFCERWVDAAALDDDAWRTRAQRGAEGGPRVTVVVWDGARAVAVADGHVERSEATGQDVGWLAGVHVTPAWRGQGLLARLVDAVSQWARQQGATALHLEVHEDNARAQAAYRRLGFLDTGRRRPYPLDPSAQELELAVPLAP